MYKKNTLPQGRVFFLCDFFLQNHAKQTGGGEHQIICKNVGSGGNDLQEGGQNPTDKREAGQIIKLAGVYEDPGKSCFGNQFLPDSQGHHSRTGKADPQKLRHNRADRIAEPETKPYPQDKEEQVDHKKGERQPKNQSAAKAQKEGQRTDSELNTGPFHGITSI